jgi:hypothetical protein
MDEIACHPPFLELDPIFSFQFSVSCLLRGSQFTTTTTGSDRSIIGLITFKSHDQLTMTRCNSFVLLL